MYDGIDLASGFQTNAQSPVDVKVLAFTIADRDAIPGIERYKGMIVTVQDNGSGMIASYILTAQSGTTVDNTAWAQFASGTGAVSNANNGLSLASGDPTTVQLGGQLIQNTDIDPQFFQFSINVAQVASHPYLDMNPGTTTIGTVNGDGTINAWESINSAGLFGIINNADVFVLQPTLFTVLLQPSSTFVITEGSGPGTNLILLDDSTTQIAQLANTDSTKFLQADSSGIITSVSLSSVGGVTGSGAATQIAYWDTSSDITGSNNLWWDNTNGRLGVNTNSPISTIHSITTDTGTGRGVVHDQISSNSLSAHFTGRKARGTVGSLVTVTSGDILSSFGGAGYDGTNYLYNGFVSVIATGTISTGIIPTEIQFTTTDSTGTLRNAAHIGSDQTFTITNIPALASQAFLFLVSDSGTISSRTASEIVSDLGGPFGTVTDFIFMNGSGFVGTVNFSTSTPELSLKTSLTSGSIPYINGVAALAEDNANLFWDHTDLRLGIGTSTPVSTLNVSGQSTNAVRGIVVDQINSGTQSARITMRKARGNLGSLNTIVTGDVLGSWAVDGYDGTNYLETGRILITSTGTISTGVIPTIMTFSTANTSGTLTTALTLNDNQSVTLANIPADASPGLIFLTAVGGNIQSRTASQVLSDIGAGTGTGTVTSVGLSDGSSTPIYTISGSPVTTTGTLTFSLSNQSANTVFAGPSSGSAAQPTFRALTLADMPATAVFGSGTATQIAFWSASNNLTGSSSLYWDNTNKRLGVGTSTPGEDFSLVGSFNTSFRMGRDDSPGGFNTLFQIDGTNGNLNIYPGSLTVGIHDYLTVDQGIIIGGVPAGGDTYLNIRAGGTGTSSMRINQGSSFPTTSTDGDISYINGHLYFYESTGTFQSQLDIPNQSGNSGKFLTTNGIVTSWGTAGAGSVTSVALSDGSTTPIYTISGSPVTSSGTLTFTLGTQTANTVFAGPSSGSAAQPTFRALTTADLPAGTGTVTGTGTATRVAFWSSSTAISSDANLYWDSTNHWLGIGTAVPTNSLTFSSTANGWSANNQTDQVTNYERVVGQWQSNVYTIGSYYGGSATSRSLQFGVQGTAGTTTLSGSRVFTINPLASSTSGNFDFFASTGGSPSIITMQGIANAATGTQNWLAIQPTINQTSTAGYTALYIAPQTSGTGAGVGSGNQYLINAGTSASANGGTFTQKFSVNNAGVGFFNTALGIGSSNGTSVLKINNTSFSASAWGTNGVNLASVGNTFTDTSSSGTVGTTTVANSFGTPTFAASTTTTYTTAANVYIAGAPIAGTNATITNAWALYVNGTSFLNNNTNVTGRLSVNSGTAVTSSQFGVSNTATFTTGAAYGTSGMGMFIAPNTYTSTSAGGTIGTAGVYTFGIPTLAASSSTTLTTAASFYIDGAPTAGTNVTITNPVALLVNNGLSAFQGNISTSANLGSNANFLSIGGNSLGSSGNAPILFAGATTVQYRNIMTGSTSSATLTSSVSAANLILGSGLFTTASTGTHVLIANEVINPLGTITSGGATITNTATLYINGANSATVTNQNYAAWIVGLTRIDLGSDATGDIHYRGANGGLIRLGIGTTGQVLTVTGGVPVWAAGGGATYTFSTGLTNTSSTITSNISTGVSGGQTIYGGTASGDSLTINSTTNVTQGNINLNAASVITSNTLYVGTTLTVTTGTLYGYSFGTTSFPTSRPIMYYNNTGGDTWTLPTISGNTELTFTIKNEGTGNLTVQRTGSDQIFTGSAVNSIVIYPGSSYVFQANGSYWDAQGVSRKAGTATLSAGSVTVSTNVVTSRSVIVLTVQSLGTVSVPQTIAVTARTAGTSFTITSASIIDTSVIGYEIIEPN